MRRSSAASPAPDSEGSEDPPMPEIDLRAWPLTMDPRLGPTSGFFGAALGAGGAAGASSARTTSRDVRCRPARVRCDAA